MSPPAQGPSPEEEPVAAAPEQPPVPPVPPAPRAAEGPDGQEPVEHVDDVDAAAEEEKRRYPSTIGGACYLLILGVTITGLVIVTTGHWRGGVHCIAAALVAAAVSRFLLPQRDAGMLAVRARWIDVALLGALGVLLWVLASNTPNG